MKSLLILIVLAATALSGTPVASTNVNVASNTDHDYKCSASGVRYSYCYVSGLQTEWSTGGSMWTYGLASAYASESLVSVKADSTTDAGHIMAMASFSGERTLYGGAGSGFAEFNTEWHIQEGGADGADVQINSSGGLSIHEQFYAADDLFGSIWSQPIPMLWGQPFFYSLTVYGGLNNFYGECCARMHHTLRITEWRAFDSSMQPVQIVPEPGGVILMGVPIVGVLAKRRWW